MSSPFAFLTDKIKTEVASLVAMEGYVYGFPLVLMDVSRRVGTATPSSGDFAAPINQFGRMRSIVPWDFKNVVRISTNSLWSFAFLDLEHEPIVVSFPVCAPIAASWRALNLWTDVFARGGTRTPDQNAGDFLIAGPKFTGAIPSGITKVLRSSTRYAWFLVEMLASTPKDFPAIHLLQDKVQATPLSAYGTGYVPPATVPVDSTVDLSATPYDQVRLMTGEMFFRTLASVLIDNPPYAQDAKMVAHLKKLGVVPGKEFEPDDVDPAILKGINAAPAEVWKRFATGPYSTPAPNGWLNMLNIGQFGTDYQTRAYVAYMGLGANICDDIVYPTAFVDGAGKALDGAHQYVIHLTKEDMTFSSVGVWSFSAYRENFYVQNPIERYGLLPAMPTYNADGSLDVLLQADSPGPAKESNWLPIPRTGVFNVTLRIYNPVAAVLDPAFRIPPITRVR